MANEWNSSDLNILAELGERLCRIRLKRNQTQAGLATEAGVSLNTVKRLEKGASVQLTNLVRILRALDLLENLATLVPDTAVSPIQQLRTGEKERRRASGSRDEKSDPEPWTWGDDE